MVGSYALGLAVTTPLFIFLGMNLRTVQVTDVKSEYSFGDYLGFRSTTSIIAFVSVSILVAVFYSSLPTRVILLVACLKFVESIQDVIYAYLQRWGRMDHVAMSMMFKGFISMIVFALTQWLTRSLLASLISMLAVWMAVLVLFDFVKTARTMKQCTPEEAIALHLDWKTLRKLLRLSFPLGISAMLVSLIANIPRYSLNAALGVVAVGIFSSMTYVMQAGVVLVASVGQSASTVLAQSYMDGDMSSFFRRYSKLLGFSTVLGFLGVLMAIFGGQTLLVTIYNSTYATHSVDFIWIMVIAALSYVASMLSFGLNAARYFNIQPIIFIVELVFGYLICRILVPNHGISGAIWALLFMSGFQVTAMAIANVHAIKFRRHA